MNIGVHVSFWIRVFIFPEYIPGSTIAGSYGSSSQSYGFSSSHVWIWELNHKEGWEPKNWCFWTVVLVKTLESPLDCKETKPVHPKGYQSWTFIGGTDAEAEAPILWPHDLKRPECWGRVKAGGEGDDRGWDGFMASPTQWTWVWASFRRWWRKGNLACCSPWGCKDLNTTEWLNNDKRKNELCLGHMI